MDVHYVSLIHIAVSFFLFILLNAALILRPTDLVPRLEGLPIYEILIWACIVASAPRLLDQLRSKSLTRHPITACVVGLVLVAIFSRVLKFQFHAALDAATSVVKLLIYYLLLVANVDLRERFYKFLAWMTVFILIVGSLAILEYHGCIDVPAVAPLAQRQDQLDDNGDAIVVMRLRAAGIFHDPNDFCLSLLLAVGVCAYAASAVKLSPHLRLLALLGVSICTYGVFLTHSRGGFLSSLSGALAFLIARFGVRKSVPFAAVVLPVMFVLFAGRQTDVSFSEGTGQDRIRLWSEGLQLFRSAPLLGIGKDQYVEEVGHVAHNSYLHAFIELGFIGGVLFVGGFIIAFKLLGKPSDGRRVFVPELARARPYLIGIVGAYATLLLTLSRVYVVPTYQMLGLVTAYASCAQGKHPVPLLEWNRKLVTQLFFLSAGLVVATYLFVRLTARWS